MNWRWKEASVPESKQASELFLACVHMKFSRQSDMHILRHAWKTQEPRAWLLPVGIKESIPAGVWCNCLALHKEGGLAAWGEQSTAYGDRQGLTEITYLFLWSGVMIDSICAQKHHTSHKDQCKRQKPKHVFPHTRNIIWNKKQCWLVHRQTVHLAFSSKGFKLLHLHSHNHVY